MVADGNDRFCRRKRNYKLLKWGLKSFSEKSALSSLLFYGYQPIKQRTRKGTFNVSKQTKDDSSLAHTRWNGKYHVVFCPKYRRKIIYG